MEVDVLSRQAEEEIKTTGEKKKKKKCSRVPQHKAWRLNNSEIQYLHSVCFSRGGLPIGEYGSIISTQNIFNSEKKEAYKTENQVQVSEYSVFDSLHQTEPFLTFT